MNSREFDDLRSKVDDFRMYCRAFCELEDNKGNVIGILLSWGYDEDTYGFMIVKPEELSGIRDEGHILDAVWSKDGKMGSNHNKFPKDNIRCGREVVIKDFFYDYSNHNGDIKIIKEFIETENIIVTYEMEKELNNM